MRIPIVSRQNLHSCQLGAYEVSWLPAAFFAARAAAVECRWRPFGAPQPWGGDSFTPLPRPALFCSNSSDHLSAHRQARSVIFIGLHSLLIPEGHGGAPFLRVTFANVAKRPPLLVELRRATATGISNLEPLRASSAPTFSLHAHEELYHSLPI
ncbi:hypothetical protein QC762_0051110 [Podospora pseudocomata]|uniref:Uncharacterized protein n=1 Tax=Podospora pseudocomata TaxID=2093779 RepID=A0ABR0GIH7_9PEZI|nr:hypothetical protein QC762_0051110 [Podospora pseudocomata]